MMSAMLKYGLAVLVLTLGGVACSNQEPARVTSTETAPLVAGTSVASVAPSTTSPADASLDATASASGTALAETAPFRFSGPNDTVAGSAAYSGSWGIFELSTGSWYEVTPLISQWHYAWETPTAQQVAGRLYVGWIGNDKLRVGTERTAWVVALDGRLSMLGGYDPIDYVDRARFSHDWQWASSEGSFDITVATNAGPGPGATTPRYRLQGAGAPMWAPDGHTLAFIGNRCSGERLLLFDADTGLLRDAVTSPYGGQPIAFDWSDDGATIALVVSRSDIRPNLLSVDVASGVTTTLTTIVGNSGWITPSWSPDGKHVLLGPSDRLTECDFEGAVPPTAVKRLP